MTTQTTETITTITLLSSVTYFSLRYILSSLIGYPGTLSKISDKKIRKTKRQHLISYIIETIFFTTILILAYYTHIHHGSASIRPNVYPEIVFVSIGISYFTADLIACLYLNCMDLSMALHHIICVVGGFYVLYTGSLGSYMTKLGIIALPSDFASMTRRITELLSDNKWLNLTLKVCYSSFFIYLRTFSLYYFVLDVCVNEFALGFKLLVGSLYHLCLYWSFAHFGSLLKTLKDSTEVVFLKDFYRVFGIIRRKVVFKGVLHSSFLATALMTTFKTWNHTGVF